MKINIGFAVACLFGVLSFVHGVKSYGAGAGIGYPLFGAFALALVIGMWVRSRQHHRGAIERKSPAL